jgi:beta-xylosidase
MCNYLSKYLFIPLFLTALQCACYAQQPGRNPVIPDYSADPSVASFNGVYYLYGTSDIDQKLDRMGPPVVWKSPDLINWSYNGNVLPVIDWSKPYSYKDRNGTDKTGYFRFWAPGKVFKKESQYLMFATIVKPNGQVGAYLLAAAVPEGPFHFTTGTGVYFNEPEKAAEEAKPVVDDIDGEPFVDDDGSAYLVWRRRNISKLSPDWKSLAGDKIVISTSRQGYSEGPFLFKRKGIYYYVYTLSGGANYVYAYMMSKTGPLGPYSAPSGPDIISQSNIAANVWGPGHGNVFEMAGTGQYVFFYLEYGNGYTTRQVFANKLDFNADGTIKPVKVDRTGIAALLKNSYPATIKPLTVKASGFKADSLIKSVIDTAISGIAGISPRDKGNGVIAVQRVMNGKPENAVDGNNGTFWMAPGTDVQPWLEADLGSVKNINKCELYFVASSLGHTWKLEKSIDGKKWVTVKTSTEQVLKSPEVADKIGLVRYLKVTVLSGVPGLWEMKLY